MAIITLTTDMGTRDHYVAVVKAAIMQQEPSATVVDITHEVKAFHAAMAAHVVRNAFPAFPEGTIHIVGVNPEADGRTAHVAVRHEGHLFVAADNGILPLVFEGRSYEAYELTMKLDDHHAAFPIRSVFVKAACHLARGGKPETIGRRMEGLRESIGFAPSIQGNAIVGRVTHVDHYGNVMTNVKRDLFDEMRGGRPFRIRLGRSDYDITKLHRTYGDVVPGAVVAFFNAGGQLEIAVNQGGEGSGGGASSLLGLAEGNAIRVEFGGGR